MDDEENGWTVMGSIKKQKGANVTFKSSRGQTRPPANHKLAKEPTANLKFANSLQALETKRSHKEKGSAGSAPAPVVTSTTGHDIRPIDALTFDKANTVASIGGELASPEAEQSEIRRAASRFGCRRQRRRPTGLS